MFYFQPTSMVHLPGRSRSSLPSAPESPPQHPPSACQITIDGQPPFLVPHLDAQHAALESGEACISKGEVAPEGVVVWLKTLIFSSNTMHTILRED